MKKVLCVALAAQMLLMVPHVASAQGRRHRGGSDLGSFIGGLIVGGVAGFLISKLTSGDRRRIDYGVDSCVDGWARGACDRDVYLPDYRQPVRVVPHQRVYFMGQPNECRAIQIVSRGRVVDTQYRCLDGNRWVQPRPHWGQPRYFDRPGMDPRMRRWDYYQGPAPVVVAPRPNGHGTGHFGARPGGTFATRPGAPDRLPPTGSFRTQPVDPRFQQRPGGPAPMILPPVQQPRGIR